MPSYTKCDYISPVESFPKSEDVLDQKVDTTTLGVTVTVWGCDECGSLVWDQAMHNRWHHQKMI
jgi:hypothetical protein